MEAGRTVVLLNLDNLYESLYDLLNQVGAFEWIQASMAISKLHNVSFNLMLTETILLQYYTKMGHIWYVDLGLQTHRIKCRVHDDFK